MPYWPVTVPLAVERWRHDPPRASSKKRCPPAVTEQLFAFEFRQSDVPLGVGAVEPVERLVLLVPPRVYLRNLPCRILLMLRHQLLQVLVGFRRPAGRVVCHGKPRAREVSSVSCWN